jgi:cob(I)alamin adenosyltransferase
MQGYIQVYTGDGKGKTTAAIGMAIRAVGAGKKVYIAQFVKGKVYSEIKALQTHFPEIPVEQFGRGCFIRGKPTEADIQKARAGFEQVKNIIYSAEYDIVILDEVFIALYFELISDEELITLLKEKPSATELILTGRYAPQAIIEMADLVTEMKEVKHYYGQGVMARKGVES